MVILSYDDHFLKDVYTDLQSNIMIAQILML